MQILIQPAWGGARESAFLTSSQVRSMLLAHGPHSEKQKDIKQLYGVMEIFYILPVVVVTWVYTFTKIPWTVYLKWVLLYVRYPLLKEKSILDGL